MKFFEVLKNLEDYDLYEYKPYRLTRNEAETVIKALKVAQAVDDELNRVEITTVIKERRM